MRFTQRLSIAAMCLLLAAAPAPPTMEQIQQAFDAGKYQDAIRQITIVLPLKGDAGAAYDRAKLLAIKAEAHVRLKQYKMASDAFALAARETKDDTLNATYRASSILMKQSPSGKYQPKTPTTQQADPKAKPEAIDVVEPASRKQALAALFNDESKTVLSRVESFKKQTSLTPVMNAIKQVADLRVLELAGTDKTDISRQALSTLGEHANTLMADACKKMSETVEKIAATANEQTVTQQTNADGTVDTITYKRGLTSVDKNNLQGVVNTCKSIGQACDELTAALGADGAVFAASRQQASTLETRADQVLKTNYDPDVKATGRIVTPGTPRGYR